MREIGFTAIMKPIGKARPRSGPRGFYTPKATSEAEAFLAAQAKAAMAGTTPIATPVALFMHAIMPMPKSWSKKKRAEMNGRPHTSTPDLDNILKLVCDGALNGIVIEDDRQIFRLDGVQKTWGEQGRIGVLVRELIT